MTSLISYSSKIFLLILALLFVGCTSTHSLRPQSIQKNISLAVLPIENLSGKYAPLNEIRQTMIGKLKELNFSILDDEKMERFMSRHRIRYVGGLDSETAMAFRDETGVDGVIITSLELFSEGTPPKIALNCRMLSTDNPSIVWMDSIGLTGDDSPGLLGLGIINKKEALMDKAFSFLFESLIKRLSGEETALTAVAGRYNPKMHYSAPNGYCPGRGCRVAVVPFYNSSERKNAGDIMALHFVKELLRYGFSVIEPGDVRQRLLNIRVIMNDGLSISDAYFLSNALEADLIFTGRVLEYRDLEATGVPQIDFSTQVFYAKEKKVIWSSKSYNRGDDGVLMFDIGRLNTANRLATYMTKNVISSLIKENIEGSHDKGYVEKNGKRRLWGFYVDEK